MKVSDVTFQLNINEALKLIKILESSQVHQNFADSLKDKILHGSSKEIN